MLGVSHHVAQAALRDSQTVPTFLGETDIYAAGNPAFNNWWWFVDMAWLMPRHGVTTAERARAVIERWVELNEADAKRNEEDELIAQAEAIEAERRRRERLSSAGRHSEARLRLLVVTPSHARSGTPSSSATAANVSSAEAFRPAVRPHHPCRHGWRERRRELATPLLDV